MAKILDGNSKLVEAENAILTERLKKFGYSLVDVYSGRITLSVECSQGSKIKYKKIRFRAGESNDLTHLVYYFITNHEDGTFSLKIIN